MLISISLLIGLFRKMRLFQVFYYVGTVLMCVFFTGLSISTNFVNQKYTQDLLCPSSVVWAYSVDAFVYYAENIFCQDD
jgi:hypothetical protein